MNSLVLVVTALTECRFSVTLKFGFGVSGWNSNSNPNHLAPYTEVWSAERKRLGIGELPLRRGHLSKLQATSSYNRLIS